MRYGLGWLAMIIGVLGALFCLVSIPVIWVAHGAAQPQARALLDAVDGSLGQAAALIAEAEAGLRTVESRLGSLQRRADAIAAGSGVDEQGRAELRALLDGVTGVDYEAVRAAYIAARGQAATGLTVLTQFAWLPGVSAPTDEAVNQAVQIDTQLQALAAELDTLRTTLAGTELSLSEVAARVARQVDGLEQQVTALDETVGIYAAAVNSARARVPALTDNTASVITGSAVGLMLVALYGAMLHGALFLLGRSWTRRPTRVAATSSAASQ